jgi:hypothetical protein
MSSDPFAALLPALADTMKFATQALAQANAIADVLIEKGLITKAELDAKMSQGQQLRDSLLKTLDEQSRKQS